MINSDHVGKQSGQDASVCVFCLTGKQSTTVPAISLMLKGFLGIEVAFRLIILALHLVISNASALLFSCPSHLFV